MSVSHKIVNVSVSHKIVIYRVLVRGADRLVLKMVCNGPYWCPVDWMLRNGQKQLKQVKEYFVTYRHFLRDLQKLAKFV